MSTASASDTNTTGDQSAEITARKPTWPSLEGTTPGPWSFEQMVRPDGMPLPDHFEITGGDELGETYIAECYTKHDAALIAAAPAMRAALDEKDKVIGELVEALQAFVTWTDKAASNDWNLVQQARTALAHAGEQA